MNYYYNNVPGKGLCRNNLIYTSLINEDKTKFIQWYYNDTDYHKGQNQVVDPKLMKEKFSREVKYLRLMQENYPHLVPNYYIDISEYKIYLDIEGPDMWEQAGCQGRDYSSVLPNWKEQMLEIIQAHKDLGIYKYSMHPSSYFIADGQLKSINYFFTYSADEDDLTPMDVMSHISEDRQSVLIPAMEKMGIDVNVPQPLNMLQGLCFDSFRNNFEDDVMDAAKAIYGS
jgi:hypothetical protein